jgi:hypothetical protein
MEAQVTWLEASLMGLTMMQLDMLSHDVDPDALSQVSDEAWGLSLSPPLQMSIWA